MDTVYVVRQRSGWGVEHAGRIRSGHKCRDAAIEAARAQAARSPRPCRLRIQEDAGAWREERSFAGSEGVPLTRRVSGEGTSRIGIRA